MKYEISDLTVIEMDNKHTYHPPTEEQVERYQRLRQAAREYEELIRELTPPSREQSVAITHLETTTFWANASIARNE